MMPDSFRFDRADSPERNPTIADSNYSLFTKCNPNQISINSIFAKVAHRRDPAFFYQSRLDVHESIIKVFAIVQFRNFRIVENLKSNSQITMQTSGSTTCFGKRNRVPRPIFSNGW